jgi:Flp pilus assembly protein TadG
MPNIHFPVATRRSLSVRQNGVAAVEFAIIMFFLLMIGAGIVEFGRAFWYYNAMLKGTRDAARFLSSVPTANIAAAGSTAQAIVASSATAGGVPAFSNANVTVSCVPTACSAAVAPSDISRVTVRAQYALGIGDVFPFVVGGGFTVSLAPHTTMPYLW